MKKFLYTLPLFLLSFTVYGGTYYKGYFSTAALNGYDVVAYHTEGKALKGTENIAHDYQGDIFWFQSKKNKDLFKGEPKKYLPAYHGHCAYALGSYGKKVKVDPRAFEIVDGILYLNYSQGVNNQFNADQPALITKGKKNWKKLTNQ